MPADVFVLKLNVVQVLALSAAGVAAGVWLKDRISLLDRLHIPAPVVGGLLYAMLALALRGRYVNFEMDLVLRDILMVAFFTTVGLSASFRLLRKGGVQVGWFLVLASVTAAMQNLLGIGLASLLGLPPLLGVVTGSVSMTGGPATALAFGPLLEQMGAPAASTVGLAAAMFGIVAGGLLGGYAGGRLIKRHGLRPAAAELSPVEQLVYEGREAKLEASAVSSETVTEHTALWSSIFAIAVAMGLGTLVSAWFERAGLTLPSYVGAMMAAGLLRNLDDRFRWIRISQREIDNLGHIALSLFIVMALLTLRLWELIALAAPLFAILAAQVALVWALGGLVYRAMGRDYDAAVMAGGFSGFTLGTTANALACMQVLTEKFGPAPRAYIVVPLVGAFFLDFTNALIITTLANLFR
jgi:ESS family glutamate:Na+ symporter